MWNGYTWIDQTTYLETAGRDALDQMLFIEAERMANGLYEPADCESERTVIISELQGGENDPDQLLDTEVTATAFRAHPYRHPTIGWLDDLRSMTPRRSLSATTAALHPEQRDARRRRRRGGGRRAAPGRANISGAIPSGRRPPRVSHRRAAADRRAPRRRRAAGDDGVPEACVARAGSDRCRLLPDARARRRPDRRQGRQSLGQLPRRAAAAQGAALHGARRARRSPRPSAARCCRPRSRSSTRCR